jgi:nucleoside-diphosphate-sugar epimerase
MHVLITGASGFLGQYVVACALRSGHRVRAIDRRLPDENGPSWRGHPGVEVLKVDLGCPDGIASAVKGADAVVHLASVKEGDFETQFAGTVLTTRNLLDAMAAERVRRLIVTSSFSVFDYFRIPCGETIDEESPIEQSSEHRDPYTRSKLIQEQAIRDFQRDRDGAVTILRPGVIYGRGNLWTDRLGVKLGRNLWLRIGSRAQLPMSYVENCAEAIIAALESDAAVGATLNIVDDEHPTQRIYARLLSERMLAPPWMVPVSWALMRVLASAVWKCNRLVFQGRLKLPGILAPRRLHARFKPLEYENRRAKETLRWKPRYVLQTALHRSCGDLDLLHVPCDSAAIVPTRLG